MKPRMSILTAASLIQWLCLGFCFAADQIVPLKTDMATIDPKTRVYDCAPYQTKTKPCDSELLEAPVIQVPENTVNLSKGKPVISSDANPVIGDLKMVTDGEKTLCEGSCVELEIGQQWVQIDLGQECDINGICIRIATTGRK